MPWQTISAADVKASLSGPEMAAMQGAALAPGQVDPLAQIMAQAVEEVRGYIAAASNPLELGAKVPTKLVRATVVLIRYRLLTRLPLNSPALIEQRRREYEDTIRLLERVADGKFSIEDPQTEDPAQPRPRGRSGSVAPVTF